MIMMRSLYYLLLTEHFVVVVVVLDGIMLISNIRENGVPIGNLPDGEMWFHHDMLHVEMPHKGTCLYSVEVPSKGGNTCFANCTTAYEKMPAELRNKLEGIANEMQMTLLHSAFSPIVKEGMDCSAALFTADAQTIAQAIKASQVMSKVSDRFHNRSDFLFLGRGLQYPVALEGALKLKEVSYIHAEGYAAGEMKHGPIALIDERMPVVTIAPDDAVFEKMLGNMQEVKARGGSVIALTTEGDTMVSRILHPSVDAILADRKSTRLNSSHTDISRMPSSA